MEYYSAIYRNEIGSFVEMWLDLESVVQSEVANNFDLKPCVNLPLISLPRNYEGVSNTLTLHAVEYYAATKKDGRMPFAATWINLDP